MMFNKQNQVSRWQFMYSGCLLALTTAVGVITGCGGVSPVTQSTTFGPGRALGNGTVRAFVTRDSKGTPINIGAEFTEETRQNLPPLKLTASGDAYETLLTLPSGASQDIAFEGLSLFESPGHAPAGNQDVQHWHLDAYTISQAERNALTPGLTFDPTVSASKLVPGHINVFVFVPQQGYIYIDPTIEMWSGRPFKTTGYAFYYAFGNITTFEISAADTFLVSKQNSEFDIPQPASYPKTGFYYPTHGSVTYDATRKVYTFTYSNLVKR